MGIDYHNPICGTTACQDLSFSSNDIRFVLSTWNSAEYQVLIFWIMGSAERMWRIWPIYFPLHPDGRTIFSTVKLCDSQRDCFCWILLYFSFWIQRAGVWPVHNARYDHLTFLCSFTILCKIIPNQRKCVQIIPFHGVQLHQCFKDYGENVFVIGCVEVCVWEAKFGLYFYV